MQYNNDVVREREKIEISNATPKDPANPLKSNSNFFHKKRELTLNAKYLLVCPGWRSVIVHRETSSLPSFAGPRVIVNWRLDSGSISSAWGGNDMVVFIDFFF